MLQFHASTCTSPLRRINFQLQLKALCSNRLLVYWASFRRKSSKLCWEREEFFGGLRLSLDDVVVFLKGI